MRLSSFLLVVFPLVLAGCSVPSSYSGKTTVVASIYPLGFAMQRIAGDDAAVSIVTPTGTEPHEFEPTPRQIVAAIEADLFVYNGGGIDPWADSVARERTNAGKLSVKALAVDGTLLAADSVKEDEFPADPDIAFDPHIWLDPIRLSGVAALGASALSDVDPVHDKAYFLRFSQLERDLVALDKAFNAGLRICELRDVIVSHDAYRYLARRYGLTLHALSGLSPEDEGSLSNVVEIKQAATSLGLTDVFAETLIGADTVAAFAADIGGTVRVLNPIEGLMDAQLTASDDYLSLMRQNLAALRQSLRCQ